jgi:hypothetical protein
MPTDHLSCKLTIYHDGQFWVGLFERHDAGELWLARVVFGPEPSLPQIAELVAGPAWRRLRFLPAGCAAERPAPAAANPKRRQREAAREARVGAPSTRSQDAMKAAIEEAAQVSEASWRERRAALAEERWQQRVAKRKEKKRGH